MQLSVRVFVFLFLALAGSEGLPENLESSTIEAASATNATTITSTITTTIPEEIITVSEGFKIKCVIDGNCSLPKDSVLYDEFEHDESRPHFHSILRKMIHLSMPKRLQGDRHFGGDILHIAAYNEDLLQDPTNEIMAKLYRHALTKRVEMLQNEGTYYHRTDRSVFLCLKSDYNKEIKGCTQAINDAYDECLDNTNVTMAYQGICNATAILELCKTYMDKKILEHCKTDPRPLVRKVATSLCKNSGTGVCENFDAFTKTHGTCFSLETKEEFQYMGNYKKTIFPDSFRNGSLICNLFSSYLNGSFQENFCAYLKSEYSCLRSRHSSNKECEARIAPLVEAYESMCGKPDMGWLMPTEEDTSGANSMTLAISSVVMMLVVKLLI